MSGGPVDRSTTALGAFFVGELSLGEVLDRICRAAVDVIAPAVGAGLSTTVSGTVDARVGTSACTSPVVQELDQFQHDTGDGPCVEALRTGIPVTIDATCEPGAYPEFRRRACGRGMTSVIAMPLRTPTQHVGALTLYATRARAFTPDHEHAVAAFASTAAFVLLNHQAYWDARDRSEHLQQALRSRAEIEQAKGIIMGATGCCADDAFEQLKRQSQAENVRLRIVAHEIVQHAQGRT